MTRYPSRRLREFMTATSEGKYDWIYDSCYKHGEGKCDWRIQWVMTHAREVREIMTFGAFETFLTSYWQLSLLKMWLVELAWASLMSQAKKKKKKNLARPQHWRVADNTTYINTPFIFFSKIFKIKFFFHILYWPQELSRGLMGSVTMRRKIHECNTLLGVSIITASSELKGHTPKYFCICAKKTAHNIISNMIVLVCIIVSGTIYWVARLQP